MRVTVTCNRRTLLFFLIVMCVLSSIYYMTFHHLEEKVYSGKNTDIQQFRRDSTGGDEETPDNRGSAKSSYVSNFILKSELKGATVLTRSKTSWSRDDGSCDGDNSFVKTTFHSPAGNTPMYVHPANKDKWVSGAVLNGEVWEGGTVKKFYNILKRDPSLQFIDIGANIGMYGLTIALMGRQVVFVEPLLTNVKKLCHSVRDGRFTDAYVIHNAMSSKRFAVGFGTYEGNIGGTYVRNVSSDKEETAYAILLDDILDIFNLTTVAMKLDVEAHEGQVLQGGDNFFSKVDVKYLVLEWRVDKKATGKSIVEFLTRHKMKPYHPDTDKPLDTRNHQNWPGDVFWIKRT